MEVEVAGRVQPRGETCGEIADQRGAGALGAVHVVRQADDQCRGGVRGELLVDRAGERVEQGVARAFGDWDLERVEGRDDAGEVVADGEAGAFVAEIDGEVAGHGAGRGWASGTSEGLLWDVHSLCRCDRIDGNMATVRFEIPTPFDAELRRAWGDLDIAAKESLIVESYRTGRLSIGQVAAILGVATRGEAEQWLGHRGVPWNYSIDDFEADAATVETLLARG